MPPARRVAGLSVLSNTAPKIVGDMLLQSKPIETFSNNNVSISLVSRGISIRSSANSPPFTYGNAANFSSMYGSRSLHGVSSTLNSLISRSRATSGLPMYSAI